MEVIAREPLCELPERRIGPPVKTEADRRQIVSRSGAFGPIRKVRVHDQDIRGRGNETLDFQLHARGPSAGDEKPPFLDDQALRDAYPILSGGTRSASSPTGLGHG